MTGMSSPHNQWSAQLCHGLDADPAHEIWPAYLEVDHDIKTI